MVRLIRSSSSAQGRSELCTIPALNKTPYLCLPFTSHISRVRRGGAESGPFRCPCTSKPRGVSANCFRTSSTHLSYLFYTCKDIVIITPASDRVVDFKTLHLSMRPIVVLAKTSAKDSSRSSRDSSFCMRLTLHLLLTLSLST